MNGGASRHSTSLYGKTTSADSPTDMTSIEIFSKDSISVLTNERADPRLLLTHIVSPGESIAAFTRR
jgi:hypothetical protein